ncbi:MAG: LexA family transcriptional regulator [Verrucomicrobiota bacterium]
MPCSRNYLSMVEKGRDPSASFKRRIEELEKAHSGKSDSLVVEAPMVLFGTPKQKLKAGRMHKGYSAAQFAKAVGYTSTATYLDIEDGSSRMGEKMARKAANLLGIDVSELMDGADEPLSRSVPYGTFGAVPDIVMGPGMEGKKAKYVPLLAMAECGKDVCWEDGGYTGEGYLAIDVKDPKAFAVILSGDSMIPNYCAGDVALVYPSFPARNGMVVIARLDEEHGQDVMCKLFQASGQRVTLSSHNPAFPPMDFEKSNFQFIYPVAQVTKPMPGFGR